MSSPSKPVNISSPRATRQDLLDVAQNSLNNSPGRWSAGTPPIRNVRGTPPPTPPIANIPPRTGTPNFGSPSRTGLDSPGTLGVRSTPTQTGVSPYNDSPIDLDNIPDEEKARVLRRHLVSRQERQNRIDRRSPAGSDHEDDDRDSGGVGGSSRVSMPTSRAASPAHPVDEELEPFPIPYDTPGGDITHPLYKWQANQRRQAIVRSRSATFTAPSMSLVDPAFDHIHEPGGFRRNYVIQRANEQGEEEPHVSNNFIEFLYIFGHFAGEDLEEYEEEDEDSQIQRDDLEGRRVGEGSSLSHRGPSVRAAPDLHKLVDATDPHGLAITRDLSESAPLIARGASKRSLSRGMRKRRSSVGPHGDATVTQAVLMLLKSFVGTGVLFLGKAFFNGGILFSALTLAFIALISLYSFLLLVKTKLVVPGSFGDIGGTLYGPWMRYAILASITLSQVGFVSAYTIFVAANLQAFVMAVTDCIRVIPVQYIICAQLIVVLPLALVRNIAKLSTTALVADVFILAGLVYIFGSEMALIANRGIAKVELFNAKDFPLLIGTAVFSFEGIGLVIPITDSMREPRKFPAVLTGVMLFLMVLFGGSGVLAYAAFGPEIQTLVIVNLNGESKLVQAVQFLYSMAILLSVPLQLFPAVRIMENGIFTRSGKGDTKVKWQKNAFRFMVVLGCTVISWIGAQDLDKFVAFIGSFACVPLCYVYPPMLHYKARAHTRRAKIADIILMIFGAAAAIYTTAQTIRLMLSPEPAGSPKFGKCDPGSSLSPSW